MGGEGNEVSSEEMGMYGVEEGGKVGGEGGQVVSWSNEVDGEMVLCVGGKIGSGMNRWFRGRG